MARGFSQTALNSQRAKNQFLQQQLLQQEQASFDTLQNLLHLTRGSLGKLLDMQQAGGSQKEILKHAYILASGGNDLITSIVTTKRDFYSAGFGVTVTTPNNTYKGRMRERFDAVLKTGRLRGEPRKQWSLPGPTHPLSQVASELITDWCSTDNSILQWAVKGSDLLYVTTLAPHQLKYQLSPAYERLWIDISKDTQEAINSAWMRKDTPEGQKVLNSYPSKYVKAVREGKTEVELRNEDGEFWTVRTQGKTFDGFFTPTMRSIFMDVLLREMLVTGDWSLAFAVKRLLEIVTMGESVPGSANVDLRELYPTPAQIAAVKQQFTNALGDFARIFGDHTLKVSHVAPDPKLFSGEKYTKVEERILRWGGIADVILTGKGDGYAQGHLGARRFISAGKLARKTVGAMITEFLQHDSMQKVIGIPFDATCTAIWDEQNLKDPDQVAKELQAAWDRGLLSNETYLDSTGYEASKERTRKEAEHKDNDKTKVWRPTFEPSQGLLQPQDTGRPQENEVKTQNQPRPSKTKG